MLRIPLRRKAPLPWTQSGCEAANQQPAPLKKTTKGTDASLSKATECSSCMEGETGSWQRRRLSDMSHLSDPAAKNAGQM